MTVAPQRFLYGADGEPLDIASSIDGNARERTVASKRIMRSYQNFVSSIYGIRGDSIRRSTDPFANHAWVYAAAMARSVNLSQAPFMVWQETKQEIANRTEKLLSKGLQPEPPRNRSGRRAIARHLNKSGNPHRFTGARFKGVEQYLSHPFMDVMLRANDHMTGVQLWQATELFMALRGECFWLMSKKNGARLTSESEYPEELYPISPDLVEADVDNGRLVGWRYKQGSPSTTTISAPIIGDRRGDITLLPWELVHFRYISPTDYLRGYSPLIPVAQSIAMDMTAKTHNMSIIANGANPGGILLDKGATEPWSAEEESDFMKKWQQRHQGSQNRGELAILTGGLEYIPTGMSPKDMDYLDSMRYSREEVFAALRVPKTVVGVTDAVNYATQLGQDANLWDKCLLPEIRYFEDVIDSTILFREPDSTFAAFDLTGIEALRTSLGEKISMVTSLTNATIHMPPKEAFELVGLEVSVYEGSDVCLIAGVPVKTLLNPPAPPTPPVVTPPVSTPTVPAATSDAPTQRLSAPRPVEKLMQGNAYWKLAEKKIYAKIEPRIKRAWRGFVSDVKRSFFSGFEVSSKTIGKEVVLKSPSVVKTVLSLIPSDAELLEMIQSNFLEANIQNLQDVYRFTVAVDLGGVGGISLSDPKIARWFQSVDKRLADTAAFSLQQNIRNAVQLSIENGESLVQMRQTLGNIFRISANDGKTLMVARTEAGSLVNNARHIIHRDAGFTKFKWSTAGDEFVRDSHASYGSKPPQKSGHKYARGLEFPHDPRCEDSSEIINCRCMLIPIE